VSSRSSFDSVVVVNFLSLVETDSILHAFFSRVPMDFPVHFRRVVAQIMIPPESYAVKDSFVVYILFLFLKFLVVRPCVCSHMVASSRAFTLI